MVFIPLPPMMFEFLPFFPWVVSPSSREYAWSFLQSWKPPKNQHLHSSTLKWQYIDQSKSYKRKCISHRIHVWYIYLRLTIKKINQNVHVPYMDPMGMEKTTIQSRYIFPIEKKSVSSHSHWFLWVQKKMVRWLHTVATVKWDSPRRVLSRWSAGRETIRRWWWRTVASDTFPFGYFQK